MDPNVEAGLKAFRRGAWTEAIQAWAAAAPAESSPVAAALAEAHFRRALESVAHPEKEGIEPAADLVAATGLKPGEGRYWYHLGLARHRRGELPEAASAYERAGQSGFSRVQALAYVRGLLALETGAPAGGDGLEGVLVRPFAALLERDWEQLEALPPFPPEAQGKGAPAVPGMVPLCRGLGLAGLQRWEEAAKVLDGIGPGALPVGLEGFRVAALVDALRALGRGGEADKILKAAFARTRSGILGNKMAASGQAQLDQAIQEGRWADAARAAAAVVKEAPGNLGAVAALGNALDRLARDAAAAGRWGEAAGHWKDLAGQMGRSMLGTPDRLAGIHHNLALSLERQEKWKAAAEAWLACGKAMPKRASKATAKPGALVPAKDQEELRRRREWIERRALEMHRRGGSAPAILRQEKALLKRIPDDPKLHLEHARNLLMDGRAGQAWREAEKILRKSPQLAEGMELLAESQLEEGYLSLAESTLRKGLELHSAHAGLRRGLSKVIMEKARDLTLIGMERKALPLLEEALGLCPQDIGIRLALGEMMLTFGDRKAAQGHLDLALARGGGAAFCRVLEVMASRGDPEAARLLVERCHADLKPSPDSLLDAGEICLEAAEEAPRGKGKGRKAAREAWKKLAVVLFELAVARGEPGEMLRTIVLMTLADNPALALSYAERRAELRPRDPEAWLDVVVLLDGLDRNKEALAALDKAQRAARGGKDRNLAEIIAGAREILRIMGPGTLYRNYRQAVETPDELEPPHRSRLGTDEEIPF